MEASISWFSLLGGIFWLGTLMVVIVFLANLINKLRKQQNLEVTTAWVNIEPQVSKISSAVALGKLLYSRDVMKNSGDTPHTVMFESGDNQYSKTEVKAPRVPLGAFVRACNKSFDSFKRDKRNIYSSPDEGTKIAIGEARLGQDLIYLVMQVNLQELVPSEYADHMDNFIPEDLVYVEGSENPWAYFVGYRTYVIARPDFDRKIDFIGTALSSTEFYVVIERRNPDENVHWEDISWNHQESRYTTQPAKDSLDNYFQDDLFINNSYVDVSTEFKGQERDIPMGRVKSAAAELAFHHQNIAVLGPHGTAKSALTTFISAELIAKGAVVFMIETIIPKYLDALGNFMGMLADRCKEPVVFIIDDGGVLLEKNDSGKETAEQAFVKRVLGSMKNREKYSVIINANTTLEDAFPGSLDAHRIAMCIQTKNIDWNRANTLAEIVQERSDILEKRGKYFDVEGWEKFKKDEMAKKAKDVPCGGVLKHIRTRSVDDILEGNITTLLDGKELPKSKVIGDQESLGSKTAARFDAEEMTANPVRPVTKRRIILK